MSTKDNQKEAKKQGEKVSQAEIDMYQNDKFEKDVRAGARSCTRVPSAASAAPACPQSCANPP